MNVENGNLEKTHKFIRNKGNISCVERGNAGSSSPETGKTVVENWCYLPEVYTCGEEAEIQELYSKNSGEEVNFP